MRIVAVTVRRPALLMTACGLLSLAIYIGAFVAPYNLYRLARLGSPADLGEISGYSSSACALYVGAVTVLFGLYLLALRWAWRLEGWQPCLWVIALGLVAAVILTQVYPYAATDVFLYIVRGRVLGIYGRNSMLVPPGAFPTAPYLPFQSEWTRTPSPYGPLWEWTAAALARLGDGSLVRSLLVFKAFGFLNYLGCMALIIAILRTGRAGRILPGLLAFAWNPLVLLETHAMAHNDLYMVLFILLALWFWQRKRYLWVLVALALGGLIKYVPFLLLPPTWVLMRRRLPEGLWWRYVLLGGLISIVLAVLLMIPLWPGWAQWELTRQMDRIHTSGAAWVIIVLGRFIPQALAFTIGLWLMRISFALAWVIILVQVARRDGSLAQGYYHLLYAWLALGAVAFGYWYVSWLIALIPLIPGRELRGRTISFAWCGLLSMAIYTFGIGLQFWRLHLIAVPFTFVLPFLLSRGLMRLFPDPDSETGG